MKLDTHQRSQIMSEIENSTLIESALEMKPLEEPQTTPAAETEIAATTVATVSNQEAMTALVLSRVKKQSKQIESLSKQVTQLPGQFRDFERRQSKQSKQLALQIRALQIQLKQVQKQVARIRVKSAAPKTRKVSRKAKKSKSRKR